jgi:hypothetical protein
MPPPCTSHMPYGSAPCEQPGTNELKRLASMARIAWVLSDEPNPAPQAPTLSFNPQLARRVLDSRCRLGTATATDRTVEWWKAAAGGRFLQELGFTQIERYARLVKSDDNTNSRQRPT